ncbi:hypothetical protein NDI56_09700 [Haloarcula sp. S1CR25-12]|uniref:Uncharacterized protein n=1 Tax=Haloarcula saliterrae TaxID=2950534 RepID=A0ABU2FBM1_9EURY|nr:hypothetical protein [Haloarcula sp. S1CR25-12]MDS0259664.1 hypothetical protein [Haloarcula sp. S1CR25-12]
MAADSVAFAPTGAGGTLVGSGPSIRLLISGVLAVGAVALWAASGGAARAHTRSMFPLSRR